MALGRSSRGKKESTAGRAKVGCAECCALPTPGRAPRRSSLPTIVAPAIAQVRADRADRTDRRESTNEEKIIIDD